MKTIQILLIALITTFNINLFANDVNPAGKVSGKVIDRKTEQAISFATISVINKADSSLVIGVISGEDGCYAITDLPKGDYYLKITFVGYKSTEKDFCINLKQRNLDLGNIYLEESAVGIDEVIVEAERLKGEEKVDRTVYNLNDDIRKTSADGIDVLKHIPAVAVDFQDNVSFEGQSNIQFYVDGVLRNKDYVSQLDPESIDKVEVISSPGVKYDADIAAVINIVLKKEKRIGINGSIKMEIPHPVKTLFNPSASLEYGNQKFRVFANNYTHYEKFNGKQNLYNKTWLENNKVQEFTSHGEGENRWINSYTNYGVDIFLSEKTTLNLFGESSRFWGLTDDYKTVYNTMLDGEVQETYNAENDNKNTGVSNYYSMFLKQKLANEGDEFTVELSYYDYSGLNKSSYTDYYDTKTVQRKQQIENSKNNVSFKTDYTKTFNNLKQEMGTRSLVEWIDNTNETFTGEGAIGFKYQEIRQAAYYNLQGSAKKLSWQAGLRAEYSKISAGNNFENKFITLLPQANMQLKMDKGQNVKLSYRRKINRANIDDLNPFERWADSMHVQYGNPELNPELIHKTELKYGVNFGSNYISPKLFFDYSQNKIQNYSFLNSDNIMEIRKGNVGKSYRYGVGLTVAQSITKWWKVNADLSVFNQVIFSDHDFNSNNRQQKISYRVNGMNMFSLPKDFTLMGIIQYKSPAISYQREHSRGLLAIVGVSKNIGKSWQVEGFYVPFIKEFTYDKVITSANNIYEISEGTLDVQNIFAVGITYKFNKGKKVKQLNRSTEYENDVKGGGF